MQLVVRHRAFGPTSGGGGQLGADLRIGPQSEEESARADSGLAHLSSPIRAVNTESVVATDRRRIASRSPSKR